MSEETPSRKGFYKTTGAGILAASLFIPLGFTAFADGALGTGPAEGGTEVTVTNPVAPETAPHFVEASNSNQFTMALDDQGRHIGFGYAAYLGLGGNLGPSDRTTPMFADTDVTFDSVGVSGGSHVLAISGGKLYGWGSNLNGELGTGDIIPANSPVESSYFNGTVVKQAQTGRNFSVVLTDSGEVYTWGQNIYGALGQGYAPTLPGVPSSNYTVLTPTPLSLPEIESISVSEYSVYALTTTGDVYAWGSDTYGNLGLGAGGNYVLSPEKMLDPAAGVKFSQIWNTGMVGYGKGTDGKIYSWGYATGGVLDRVNSPTDEPRPLTLPAGVDFTKVSGERTGVALTTDGKVYTWSSLADTFGILGNGTVDQTSLTLVSPTLPSSETFIDISSSGESASAVTASGDMYTWGKNNNGELGHGNKVQTSTPTKVVAPDTEITNVRFAGILGNNLISSTPGEVSVYTPQYTRSEAVDVTVEYTYGGKTQAPVTYPNDFIYEAPVEAPSVPVITSSSVTVEAGGLGERRSEKRVKLSAFYTGFPTPRAQWEMSTDEGVSWNVMPGLIQPTLTYRSDVEITDDYRFRVTLFNSEGSVQSAVMPVAFTNYNQAPHGAYYSGNDGPISVVAGSPFSLVSTVERGYPLPTVQWQESPNSSGPWTDIAGATDITLNVASAEPAVVYYRSVFSNSVASNVSNNGLRVDGTATAERAPYPTMSVSSLNVREGSTALFSRGNIMGTPTPSLQWQVSEDDGATWTDIAGATGISYSLQGATLEDSGNLYRTRGVNSLGTNYTAPGLLTVNEIGMPPAAAAVDVAPVITSSPADVTVSESGSASFTVAATGTPTPSVQWQVSEDDGATWTNIAGATSYTLSVTNLQHDTDSGNLYRAEVSNTAGTVYSGIAELTVEEVDSNTVPSFSTQPASQNVEVGSDVILNVSVSGNPTPTIQWFKYDETISDWVALVGETSPQLNLVGLDLTEDGSSYRAEATNSEGSVFSDTAIISVYDPTVLTAPVFTTQPPAELEVPVGETRTITVAVSGNPTPTIQWQISEDGGVTWVDLVDQNSETISVTNTNTGETSGDQLRAVATNSEGTATSTVVSLTFDSENPLPVIINGPANATVEEGKDAIFSVEVGEPSEGVTYQWQFSADGNNWIDIADATTSVLTISATELADNNSRFRVVVTNGEGSVTSESATLTVTPKGSEGNNNGNNNGGTDGKGDGNNNPKPSDVKNTATDSSGVMLAAGGAILLLGAAVTAATISRRKEKAKA